MNKHQEPLQVGEIIGKQLSSEAAVTDCMQGWTGMTKGQECEAACACLPKGEVGD